MNHKSWLMLHFKKYGKFRVAFQHYDGKIWEHTTYPSDKCTYHIKRKATFMHREIFPDEIVLESDAGKDLAKEFYQIMKERLGYYNYSAWHSGNKSIHIHMFFPAMLNLVGNDRIKIMKQKLFEYFVTPEEVRKYKVDLQLVNKHMIRLENADNIKTGLKKKLIDENTIECDNSIPADVLSMYHKAISRKKTYVPEKGCKVKEMNCINFYLGNEFTDLRKRVLYSITSNLLEEKKPPEEIFNILTKWNKRLGNYFTVNELDLMIDYQTDRIKQGYTPPKCSYNKGLLAEIRRLDVCRGCRFEVKK